MRQALLDAIPHLNVVATPLLNPLLNTRLARVQGFLSSNSEITVTRYILADGTVIVRLDTLNGRWLYYRLPNRHWEPTDVAAIENMPLAGLMCRARTF